MSLFVGILTIGIALSTGLWLKQHLLGAALGFASVFFLFGGLGLYPFLKGDPESFLYFSLLNQVACLAFLYGFWIKHPIGERIIEAKVVFVAIGVGLIAVTISMLWLQVLSAFGVEHQEQELMNVLRSEVLRTKVLVMLFVVFLAPICEELLFRNLLIKVLRRGMSAGLAVIVSGAVFGVMHSESSTSVLPLILFGFLLGWLQITYKQTLAPILAHVTNNLVVVLLMV